MDTKHKKIDWDEVDFLLSCGETLPMIAQRLGRDEKLFRDAWDKRNERRKAAQK